MDGGVEIIARAVLVLVPMILSLSVHEFAHAFAAMRLGDDTAERQGRLNLNPMSHIDPFGTVLLPLMILITNGAMFGGAGGVPFFGWAKPVPVEPGRFTRSVTMRRGMMLVAAAGPLSNVALALLCAGIYATALHTGALSGLPEPLRQLLLMMVQINIALAIFNMLPIYPLDGHKVLSGLLPGESAARFDAFNYQFGSFLLLGVIFFARDVLAFPIHAAVGGLLRAVGVI